MARKEKPRKNPIVNKSYVWDLEVEGGMHTYTVFVGEDECVTYEDGKECKHLKIMDKTQQIGVLQIDCKTRVFDDIVPFKLEYGIPYIKIETDEGKIDWIASDTTLEDRLQAQIRQVKKQAYAMCGLGVLFLLWCAIQFAVWGTLGEWPIAPVFSVFCFAAAAMNLIQLKNELNAMGRPFSIKLNG